MECQHFIADENGLSVDCGQPVTGLPRISAQDLKLIKQITSNGLGHFIVTSCSPSEDLINIIQLADETIQEYETQMALQEDPNSPGNPKIRMIGNTIFRQTWEEIWKQVVLNSYQGALMMGYKHSVDQWDEFLRDTIEMGLKQQKLISNNPS
jgi:hypothetical protein